MYKPSKGDRVVVVLSGGQDSTTCLFMAKREGCDIHAVTFYYGQRHHREVESARQVARFAGITSHEVIDIAGILKGASPLVNPNTPLEQYADHHSLPGGLENTFVPMRNQLFLTIAANRAYVIGARTLITGVSQEDYGGYPDCRDSFISAFELCSGMGTFTGSDGAPRGLNVYTPLIYLNKAETVFQALEIEDCYEALAITHTAYDGVYPPTGQDHATLLRAKGFEEAGVPDPLVLRAVHDQLMEIPSTPNYKPSALVQYSGRVIAALPRLLNV